MKLTPHCLPMTWGLDDKNYHFISGVQIDHGPHFPARVHTLCRARGQNVIHWFIDEETPICSSCADLLLVHGMERPLPLREATI